MDMLHVGLALAAGAGWGLALGWRNARDVALGREPKPMWPTKEPPSRALVAPITQRQREEMTR